MGWTVGQILKFPDSVCRRSGIRAPTAAAPRTKAETVTEMPSRHLHVLTGKQWDEFIRFLNPRERQAFMADVFELMTEHLERIGGD